MQTVETAPDSKPVKVLYLSEKDVEPVVTPADALGYAEMAFRLYAKSLKGENPASFAPIMAYHTQVPNSDVDYRSGAMDPIPTLCSTLGFGYADNPSKYGLPSMHSVAVLSDVATGIPKCIMAQGSFFLSFLRTGAAAAIASKYLAKKEPKTIAMIGSGSLARHTLRCHIAQYGYPDEVRAWSKTSTTAERFASEMMEELSIEVKASPEARKVVNGADIIYCTTRSKEPVVMDEWVEAGMHISAFGSDAPGKQELDSKILKRAKVVVDSFEQCVFGGEISKPMAQGLMVKEDVYGELGEIVNGWKQGRERKDEITVMDSTGLAALDVVTFHYAYEKAIASGAGVELEL